MASSFSFKKAAIAVIKLPGTIVSAIFDLIFGYKDKEGKNREGLLGLIMDFTKAVGRGVSSFIKDHIKLIATAFWLSLAATVGVGLTLLLWPMALTAVATFSIYGVSIASIVGANTLLQIGFAAGLAAFATSMLTYAIGSVVNLISWLVRVCTRKDDEHPTHAMTKGHNSSIRLEDNEQSHSHQNMLNALQGTNQIGKTFTIKEPTHHKNPIDAQKHTASNDEFVPESSNGISL